LFFSARLQNCEKPLLASPCISVCPSFLPYRTTRHSLDGLSWNLIFEYFSKICRENSSLIKMWHEWRVLCMKNCDNLWQYLDLLFLEWEIFETFLQKIKAHILSSVIFFRKSGPLWENVEKYSTAGQPDNMAHAHFTLCN
jgi:hypothetical protein